MSTSAITRAVESHLGSGRVSRVVYGAIIGLALVVAIQAHPPKAWVVAATLVSTGIAVALAEVYSEVLGIETSTRRWPTREQFEELGVEAVTVAFGVAFPAVFFVLAALHVFELSTAFALAKWSGLGLTAFYGFCAARLAGSSLTRSVLFAAAVGAIGGFLIIAKALVMH